MNEVNEVLETSGGDVRQATEGYKKEYWSSKEARYVQED